MFAILDATDVDVGGSTSIDSGRQLAYDAPVAVDAPAYVAPTGPVVTSPLVDGANTGLVTAVPVVPVPIVSSFQLPATGTDIDVPSVALPPVVPAPLPPVPAPAPVVPNTGVVTGGRSVYGGAGAVIVQTGAGSAPPVVDTAHTGLVTSIPSIPAPTGYPAPHLGLSAPASDVNVPSAAPGVVTAAPGGELSTVAPGQPSPLQFALLAAALLGLYYLAT